MIWKYCCQITLREVEVASRNPMIFSSKFECCSWWFTNRDLQNILGPGLSMGTFWWSSQKGRMEWVTIAEAMHPDDCEGISVRAPIVPFLYRVSPLPICSVVRDHEKATREVISDKHNGYWQIVRILSLMISPADIHFIRTIDSVEMLSSMNSPIDRISHIHCSGHMERLV